MTANDIHELNHRLKLLCPNAIWRHNPTGTEFVIVCVSNWAEVNRSMASGTGLVSYKEYGCASKYTPWNIYTESQDHFFRKGAQMAVWGYVCMLHEREGI